MLRAEPPVTVLHCDNSERDNLRERRSVGGKEFSLPKILTGPEAQPQGQAFFWKLALFKALCANNIPSMLATLCRLAHGTLKGQLYEEVQFIAVSRSPGRSSRFEVYGSDLCPQEHLLQISPQIDKEHVPQSVGWLFDDNFKLPWYQVALINTVRKWLTSFYCTTGGRNLSAWCSHLRLRSRFVSPPEGRPQADEIPVVSAILLEVNRAVLPSSIVF